MTWLGDTDYIAAKPVTEPEEPPKSRFERIAEELFGDDDDDADEK